MGLAVLFTIVAWRARPFDDRVAAISSEAAIVAVLYSLWQLAGTVSLLGIDRALERGAWLWDLERTLRAGSVADHVMIPAGTLARRPPQDQQCSAEISICR